MKAGSDSIGDDMIRWSTILATAALAVGGGALAWRRAQITERERSARYGAGAAVAGLRAFHGAQRTFRREDRYGIGRRVFANPSDGAGLTDLYRIGGLEGSGPELKFIDLAFASATSRSTTKAGYWFVDIVSDSVTGPYDFERECGLCAVPAISGGEGYPTFVIDIQGVVYMKDNSGKPVALFPDVQKDGWVPVGM